MGELAEQEHGPMTGPDVVTMGESMRLLVAEPGIDLARAGAFTSSIAGAETNVAIGLARQGLHARWLGRVGDDPAGEAVLRALRAEGVDTSVVEVDPEAYTGVLMRDSHPTRGITVQYYRAHSAACGLSAAFVRRRGLGGARHVHVTGITPMLSDSAAEATHALFDLAEQSGATVSFDPNIRRRLGTEQRWREVVGPLLERGDLIFAGADELEVVAGCGPSAAAEKLLGSRAAAVVIKHSDRSITVTTAHGEWRRPALARTVIDSVGAGDAVVSGYLGAWLGGAPPERALSAGALSAALVVGAVNDTEGLPDRAALARGLQALDDQGTHAEDVHR
jgi:2-dehydro-3-deoxygluconokinase